MQQNSGTFYVVATPIGNLSDITIRALEVLKSVDLILCEDTRHSKKFLSHYNIVKPLISLHQHNESQQKNKILDKLHLGKNIAIISDAGTPLISDPGFTLVEYLLNSGIKVTTCPGPCALISALSISGIDTSCFSFYGFLPSKDVARNKILSHLAKNKETLAFYEAPHRILDTLISLESHFGATRRVSVIKEISKIHECNYIGEIKNVITSIKDSSIKGEFVIIVEGIENTVDNEKIHNTLKILLSELSVSQSVKIAANILKVPKNKLYKHALMIKDD